MGKQYIDFAAVKAAVNMTQVLERYGLLADMRSIRNGDGYEGRCPIHNGSTDDQFKVSVSKNCWNCFSDCHCGGNVLDFVAKMEKVEPLEAAHRLNEWFSLGLEGQPAAPPGADNQKGNRTGHHANGATSSEHTGVQEESAEPIGSNSPLRFQLKNLNSDHSYFEERGLTKDTVETFGLGYCAKGTMSGRVVIPIHNREGELVGYVGRWPGKPPEERPKYKLPTGFHKLAEVFNIHRATQEPSDKALIIVEGVFDVMLLWQRGYRRVVSLMGNSVSTVQEDILSEAVRSSGSILLMFDEDAAGRLGRDKALHRLARRAFVRVAPLPREGAQPDDLTEEDFIICFIERSQHMDVHCTTCGEPWDTHHLWQDAIHETGLPSDAIEAWKGLPSDQRLGSDYRREFEAAGYQFGRSVINVVRCPGCPPEARPDTDRILLKGELEEIHAGDEDGLASTYEEFGL